MKSKIKKGVVITILAIVAFCILFVLWFYFFGHTGYSRKYKKLLDKAFDGNYKLTCTESVTEWGYAPFIGVKLPTRCKEYDIKYTDHNGIQRKAEIYSYPYDLYKYSLKDNIRDNDANIVNELSYCEGSIGVYDLFGDIMAKYFDDVDLELDNADEVNGIGITYKSDELWLHIICFDYKFFTWGIDYSQEGKDNNWHIFEDAMVADDRKGLKSYTLDDLADDKSQGIFISIHLLNKDLSKEEITAKVDEYAQKLDKVMAEYNALSDFGGNCRYSVVSEYETDRLLDKEIYERRKQNGEDVSEYEFENVVRKKDILFGEDVTEEVERQMQELIDSDTAGSPYKDMIYEKNGWYLG